MDYKRFCELVQQGAQTITLAGIEYFNEELDELLENGKRYIVKYRDIYRLDVANCEKGPKYKLRKVWHETGVLPLTERGRYCALSFVGVNKLIEKEVFQN